MLKSNDLMIISMITKYNIEKYDKKKIKIE